MSLTYEHMLFNYVSCEYANIVQKIINKSTNANAKGENWKHLLHLSSENNHDVVILIIHMVFKIFFTFFFFFKNKKL
jgi:hypothetical protein